ncbi:MAG: 50S ribosomal protein L15 [Candidatus Parcubacteria bacterium]|nr:MAG: 50S ribosomal protein L15 [Candidatus Parcubacteria bacterium]
MQLHQIKFSLRKRKRVGRGGKKGNYSGRGLKGQKSRAGRRIRPAVRDIILKLPKRKGFKNIKIKRKIFVINLDNIDKKFNANEIVSLKTLVAKKLLTIPKSVKSFKVKILGRGNLTKSLLFKPEFIFSDRALNKIEDSGSKIE